MRYHTNVSSSSGSAGVLVSVGIPVRNGGCTLERAIDSVLEQSHSVLEVLVSDNASTDNTAAIAQQAARRDKRLRYFRQKALLTAADNFRFVFEHTRGPFFMWAAHDDWRSSNYVEVLLRGFERDPSASLSFTDMASCPDISLEHRDPGGPFIDDCSSVGLGFWQRLRKQAQRGQFHIYGLINRACLNEYKWYPLEASPDQPLLFWLLARGDFVYVSGALFLYHNPGKSIGESCESISHRRLGRLATERIVWACATATRNASALNGRRTSRLRIFLALYVWRHRGLRNILYRWTPTPLRALWHDFKSRLSRAKLKSGSLHSGSDTAAVLRLDQPDPRSPLGEHKTGAVGYATGSDGSDGHDTRGVSSLDVRSL